MVGTLKVLTIAGLILYTGTGKAQGLNAVHPAGETECLVYLKFDEPTGDVCNDSSGHGNHAQIVKGVRVRDKTGGSLKCDGNGTGAVIKNSEGLRLGQEFTVSVWVKLEVEPEQMKGKWPSIVFRMPAHLPGAKGQGFRLGFFADKDHPELLNCAIFRVDGEKSGSPVMGLLKSQKNSWSMGWHHIVAVFSYGAAHMAPGVSLYIDGVLDSSGGRPIEKYVDPDMEIRIGEGGFCGMVDELKIYNRALNKEEVQNIYLSGLPVVGSNNISTREVNFAAQEKKEVPALPINMIPGDSSFESGINHHWRTNLYSRRRPDIEVDRSTAFHGKSSVLIRNGSHLTSPDITVKLGKSYVFSAYLKGEGKAVIYIRAPIGYEQERVERSSINLTPEWKRYSVVLNSDVIKTVDAYGHSSDFPRGGPKVQVGISGDKCWADALQFEEGTIPTEYKTSNTASISISTRRFGNIFLVGEPIQLTLSAYIPDRRDAILVYNVCDWRGNVVSKGKKVLKPDSFGLAESEITVNPSGKGFFILRARLNDQHNTLCSEWATFCRIAPPRNIPLEDSCMGICNASDYWDEPCNVLYKIGAKWMRVWPPSWAATEPEKGKFQWERWDNMFEPVLRAGFGVIPMLSWGPPSWAALQPDVKLQAYYSLPPKDVNDLGDFMRALASRYKDKKIYWLTPEEYYIPLPGGYWWYPEGQQAKLFAQMIKAAYKGVKEGNPDGKFAVNLSQIDLGDFGKEVLSLAPDSFDILTLHAYLHGGARPARYEKHVATPEETNAIERIEKVIEYLQKNAKGQEVWNTESGMVLDCEEEPDSIASQEYTLFCIRAMLVSFAGGAKKTFWFRVNDRRMPNTRKTMWLSGWQPLPVVAAYSNLAQMIDGTKQTRKLNLSLAKIPIYAFAFEGKEQATIALWLSRPVEPPFYLKFEFEDDIQVVDLMGNSPLEATHQKGQWCIPVSDSPIFLLGKPDLMSKLCAALEKGRLGPSLNLISANLTRNSVEILLSNRTKQSVSGTVEVKLTRQSDKKLLVIHDRFENLAAGEERILHLPIQEDMIKDGSFSLEVVGLDEEGGWKVKSVHLFNCRTCKQLQKIKVDGSLDEWPTQPGMNSFVAAVSQGHLCIACRVAEPEVQQPLWSANLLWLGNCLSLRFDVGNRNYHQFLVGRSVHGMQVYRAHAPIGMEVGLLDKAEAALQHQDGITTYEVAIPISEICPIMGTGGAGVPVTVSTIQAQSEKKALGSVMVILLP